MQLGERALVVTLAALSLLMFFLIFSPGTPPGSQPPPSLPRAPCRTEASPWAPTDGAERFRGWTRDYVPLYFEWWTLLDRLHQESRSGKIEGHMSAHQASYYTSLGKLPFVRTVCEIGFNGGHSAVMWLTANPDLHVYAFDLGLHSYARTAQTWIDKHFPGRLTLTLGNSVETVPAFARDHPELVCDILHIDGGRFYDVPLADLRNMHRMAARPTNLVLINDVVCPHEWCQAPQRAWDKMKAEHAIEEWECVSSGEGNKGWCAGRYSTA
jgi:hypothetical protein